MPQNRGRGGYLKLVSMYDHLEVRGLNQLPCGSWSNAQAAASSPMSRRQQKRFFHASLKGCHRCPSTIHELVMRVSMDVQQSRVDLHYLQLNKATKRPLWIEERSFELLRLVKNSCQVVPGVLTCLLPILCLTTLPLRRTENTERC